MFANGEKGVNIDRIENIGLSGECSFNFRLWQKSPLGRVDSLEVGPLELSQCQVARIDLGDAMSVGDLDSALKRTCVVRGGGDKGSLNE